MDIAKLQRIQLPVVITKQGSRFVAYTPALDISTSGKSKRDVQKKFGELVNIFFEEIIQAGTIDDVLRELGWVKAARRWNPPKVVAAETFSVHTPVFALLCRESAPFIGKNLKNFFLLLDANSSEKRVTIESIGRRESIVQSLCRAIRHCRPLLL